MTKRKDTILVATIPQGLEIVAMIEFNKKIYLATTKGVYVCIDPNKGFTPVKVKWEK